MMNDELSGVIMNKFLDLHPAMSSYLKDNDKEGNKAKGTKKCIIRHRAKFEDYKNSFKTD